MEQNIQLITVHSSIVLALMGYSITIEAPLLLLAHSLTVPLLMEQYVQKLNSLSLIPPSQTVHHQKEVVE